MRKTISPQQLMKFLGGIDAQRLRVWYERGLFGEKALKTGRGRKRLYSFEDVIAARIAQEILDLTQSRISLKMVSELLSEIEERKKHGPWVLNKDGSVNTTLWLVIRWERKKKDWRVSIIQGGNRLKLPDVSVLKDDNGKITVEITPQATIIVPVWKIIEEVEQFFKQIEEESR